MARRRNLAAPPSRPICAARTDGCCAGLKSTLGSGLIEERTAIGNRAVSFKEVLARFIGQLSQSLRAQAPEAKQVVLGRPVHFIDDDAAGDAKAQAVLEEIARAQGFARWLFNTNPSRRPCSTSRV